MKRSVLLISMALVLTGKGYAQSDDEFDKMSFDEFRKSSMKDFQNFRAQALKDFTDFVRNPWKSFDAEKPVPRPKEEDVPPIIYKDLKKEKGETIKDVPIVVKDTIKAPIPTPQPLPIEPIKEVPVVTPHQVAVAFYGYTAQVRCPEQQTFSISSIEENAIADALTQLSDEAYNNLIVDCLNLRTKWQLCDWAYLQLLCTVAEKICGADTNEATLLTAYLYQQSGYRMRFAKSQGKLYMLYASTFDIYGEAYYHLEDGYNYYGVKTLPIQLNICQAKFPKESSLSLYLTKPQTFPLNTSSSRKISSQQYEGFSMDVAVNRNLISFYDKYPSGKYGDNFVTRWAIYANTPLQQEVKDQIYPHLKSALQGKTEFEAVSRILNLVQTGLVYEYDDKVWGRDRAFFPEETLYYPYADCEDRAILFSRIVRDILGLKVILVYYPGHLAAAVHFNETVAGDFITLNGARFTITDPTYEGAPVGATMPRMDNSKATVILLE